MKCEVKNILLLVAAVAIVVLIYKYVNKKNEATGTCFDLPTSSDPAVFGPKYWEAFHSLAHQIPCQACRGFAEKFIIFFHDVVNKKLGRPVYDQANYNAILLQLNMPSA
jgi:hypothetical protein